MLGGEPWRGATRRGLGYGTPGRFAVAALALALALALAAATSADAEEPASPAVIPAASTAPGATSPATSFLIEKVVVEGVKHGSERIVAAETLLKPGESYTEPQLQQALHRVERLPFVVRAEFSLRKGSDRGRFELVVRVTETKPVFFGRSFHVLGRRNGAPGGGVTWGVFGSPEIGGRYFFGDHSEVRATLNGNLVSPTSEDRFRVGSGLSYTHHNLIGRHVVGSLAIETGAPSRAPGRQHSIRAQLTLPLSRSDALSISFSRSRSDDEYRYEFPLVEGGREDFTYRYVDNYRAWSGSWQRDTTDDPFAPRSGTRARVDVGLSSDDSRTESPWVYGPEWIQATDESWIQLSDTSTWSAGLEVGLFRPLSRRLSLGIEGSARGSLSSTRASATRGDDALQLDNERSGASAAITTSVLGTARRSDTAHVWWQVTASLAARGSHLDWALAAPELDARYTSGTLSAALASRGRWGTFVLTLQYEHSFQNPYEAR